MEEHFSQLNTSATKAEGVLHTLCNAAAQLSGTDKSGEGSISDKYVWHEMLLLCMRMGLDFE